jgi:hypothetical protein
VQVAASRAPSLEWQERGAGDLGGQCLAVRKREHRVGGAVHDQRRHRDVGEPEEDRLAREDPVVRHARREVAGAVDHTLGLAARPFLVVAERAGVRAFDLHEIVHRGRVVVPVRLGCGVLERRGDPRLHPGQGRRVGAVAGRAGSDQGQRVQPLRMLRCHLLGDAATHRQPDQVDAVDAQGVEHPHRVGRQVLGGVRRPAHWRGGGAPGVAVVVPDHEPALRHEQLAELGVPQVHRRGCAADQEYGGVRRVAERLHAQLGSVDRHESLRHEGSDCSGGEDSSPPGSACGLREKM